MSIAEKLTTIAENVRDVHISGMLIGENKGYNAGFDVGYIKGYDVGKSDGYNEGYSIGRTDGLTEGRKVEYDRFWDTFQNNGEEQNYYYAFAYGRFADANYDPKYDIVCASKATTSCQNIFNSTDQITDTKVAIYANGRQASGMFAGCSELHTVRKLVVHEELTYSNTFNSCVKLKNITIEGVIGKSIDLHWSPLTRESLLSVANALSPTATATLTVMKAAVDTAFPDRTEWDALFTDKPSWTISEV